MLRVLLFDILTFSEKGVFGKIFRSWCRDLLQATGKGNGFLWRGVFVFLSSFASPTSFLTEYSEIQQAIRLEKLDQVLKDAKSVISLSHERLYDKKTKQKLLSITSLWKKPVEEEKEEKDLQDYVTKQTTFDSVML